jgi:hypothetical protein
MGLLLTSRRFHILGGTKALMKESAKYLPILGVLRHPAAFSVRTQPWL